MTHLLGGGPAALRRLGHLVLLNGSLRPLIHRQWAAMVASMNELEESRLEEFLFGARRVPLEPVRPGLQEMQDERCFYCERPLRRSAGWRPQVDHFVPWARYPNNAIENLVVAHERCNGQKREFLAASDHVAHWRGRLDPDSRESAQLHEIADEASWEADADRSLSVARAIYLHLPADARLWLRRDEFEAADPRDLEAALA